MSVSFGSNSTTRSGQGYGLGSNQTSYTYSQGQYDRTPPAKPSDYSKYSGMDYRNGSGQGLNVYGNTAVNKYKGQFGWGKRKKTRKNVKGKRKITKRRHTKRSYKK